VSDPANICHDKYWPGGKSHLQNLPVRAECQVFWHGGGSQSVQLEQCLNVDGLPDYGCCRTNCLQCLQYNICLRHKVTWDNVWTCLDGPELSKYNFDSHPSVSRI
jgi:hypothetical protein